MEKKSEQLETLRQKNAERWRALKDLHGRCNAGGSPVVVNDSLVLSAELEISSHVQAPEPVDFHQELVSSYHELRDANVVLAQHLARDKKKLEDQKQRMEQLKSISEALRSMNEDKERSADQSESHGDNIQQENAWIRGELKHVTEQLQRRRKGEGLSSECARKSDEDEGRQWSLDRFVLELMGRYSTSSGDPYLARSTIPVEPWQVDLLKECQVIREHQDNPDLLYLSDYNGNYS